MLKRTIDRSMEKLITNNNKNRGKIFAMWKDFKLVEKNFVRQFNAQYT